MKTTSARSSNFESVFQRMKKNHINQFLKYDPRPQRVLSTQIIENLYLGSVGAAYNINTLKTFKITHILTVCQCLPPKFPTVIFIQQFQYKVVTIVDQPSAKLNLHFKECVDYIKKAIDQGGRVLVHCFAGGSRSATVVVAFLMRYKKLNLKAALSLIKKIRHQVSPNFGFMSQLRRYGIALQKYRKNHPEEQLNNQFIQGI